MAHDVDGLTSPRVPGTPEGNRERGRMMRTLAYPFTHRAAADKVHGVVYGDYVDDVDVWPLLQELGATGLTLHRWQYGKEAEAGSVVEGDGSTVIGMAFDPTGKGHFVPPAL